MAFFGLFGKKEPAKKEISENDFTLGAPVSGELAALDRVTDPVISERILGDGLAIAPREEGETFVLAPCDGTIRVMEEHNAFALKNPNGIEVYVAFGIFPHRYSSEGFTVLKESGQSVSRGDQILKVDRPTVSAEANSLFTVMIVTSEKPENVIPSRQKTLEAGQDAIWVSRPQENAGGAV